MSVRSPLGAHRRFWLLLAKPSNPAAAAAGEAAVDITGSRGQPSTLLLGPSRGHHRVRTGPYMLHHHSTAADKPPPAVRGELPRLPCCDLRPGASGSNLTK